MYKFFELQKALNSNSLKTLESVLSSFDKPDIRWGSGINLIHYYVEKAKKLSYKPSEVINLMKLFGIDVNGRNRNDLTPLHYAIHQKQLQVVKALIEAGAIVDSRANDGRTPLFNAVTYFRGEPELIEIIRLLVKSGANIDEKINSGNSPRTIVLDTHEALKYNGRPKEWDLQSHLNW